jgi:hypothetical protein
LVLGCPADWAKAPRGPYAEGALVEADPKTFYAARPTYRDGIPAKLREALGELLGVQTALLEYRDGIPAKLRESFRSGGAKPERAMLNPSVLFPIIQPTADGVRLLYDMRMLFEVDSQRVEADARLVVDCDTASLESNHPQWRVTQIQLVRARTYQPPPSPEIPGESGGPAGAVGPGGPGLNKVPITPNP